jgi:hypothetical protein
MVNTDEEIDMKDPREEEVRIIAQSHFYVNEEIGRENFLEDDDGVGELLWIVYGHARSCDLSGRSSMTCKEII